MTIAPVTPSFVTQTYSQASSNSNAATVAPAPASAEQTDTTATTPTTDTTNTQPSNPANIASTPVPQNSTPPVYSAVGNANASTIRGSGVDIVT